MGGKLSKGDIIKRCEERLSVIPDICGDPNKLFEFPTKNQYLEAAKKVLAFGVEKGGKKAGEEFKKVFLSLEKGTQLLLGIEGVLLFYVFNLVANADNEISEDKIRGICAEVCNSMLSDLLLEENRAVMLNSLKNLTLIKFSDDKQREYILVDIHNNLEIHAFKLGSRISEFNDPKHFRMMLAWCKTVKFHLTILEDLCIINSDSFKVRYLDAGKTYKMMFLYLAEGFVRSRVFNIIGSYSHNLSTRPTYDHWCGDKKICDITENCEEYAWKVARKWMRSQCVNLLTSNKNDDISSEDIEKFIPDSEIGEFYGYFRGDFSTNYKDKNLWDGNLRIINKKSPFG